VADVTGALRNSGHRPLRAAIERGETAVAVRLAGFGGLLSHRTQPTATFASELAERVRVIACPVHRPFMAHSDQEPSPLADHEWRAARSAVSASTEDSVVIAWMPRDDAATAAREIALRAGEALVGIPPETRQALPDGTTGFERILPGPDRMYPDTDTPPLPIADREVAEVRGRLPETPWARERRYRELGLDPRAASRLASAPWAGVFDAVAPTVPAVARRLATALETRVPFYARQGLGEVGPERLAPLVRALESGAVRLEATDRALDHLLGSPESDVTALLVEYRPGPNDAAQLERRVAEVAAKAQALDGTAPDGRLRWAMGQVMPDFLGRLDPHHVRDWLGRAIGVTVPGERG
jgi:glutamyl-tRNA(Gln) amidotransferase subunit E